MTAAGPVPEPVDQLAVRRINLSRTLRHIRVNGPGSRAAIAAGTGLHKTTVSSLVEELLARRLVRETGLERSGTAGRPGRGVALSPQLGAVGIEINVDYLAVHGCDLTGRTVVERRLAFDVRRRDVDGCLADLAAAADRALTELAGRGVTPVGLTVAVPGLVDVARGVVVVAPNLGWRDVPVVSRLAAGLDPALQVGVDNDANLAALAEHTWGVAAGTDDLVYLTGSVGVGGGAITGGRLLRGADGFSGEIGHLPVEPDGDPCGCGRTGCWETKVGLAELVRRITPEFAYGLGDGPVPDPRERVAEVRRRLDARDPAALDAVAGIGRWLGHGGAILVNLFNPRVVVLGGYFADLADHLIPAAQAQLTRLAMASPADRCHFVASDLGFTAAARGGAGAVIERMIDDPSAVPSG
ncbi:ROK family transcriptional regulator [Dactylosporangium aurantiacum]|uniref:ROK family transcriptional regulator n=1 Tax=Dactylosporangium aurantiacum TaxID=35754 RepID=A0A9Q9MDQ4_9ACTN|nr:ROK family transcriptional regulator [Dactylosporangium aurantiacum]MDG6106415.1 ROK family transcriptional regulator [Dactylosporangium aurantiacum]UWZ50545.1 ROK family transcriptional regulator [Dactylosporangium aurantiacum]